jgi:myo-inositol-1(or 4)-monophosphatase
VSAPEKDITDAGCRTLLHLARQAAEAGAEVLARRGSLPVEARTKSSDSDWVTAFDTASERAVRGIIAGSRPHDVITGEELGTTIPAGAADGPGAGAIRWSVDPLDGTTNFLRGIPFYCTSVAALAGDGAALVGVVHAPALRRVYWAARGQGSWISEAGRVRRLEAPDEDRTGLLLATGFSYDGATRAGQLSELPGLMEGYGDLRRLGSAALELCLVADGTLDAFYERGLHEHDFAAGALIAEEAGAVVHRPALNPVLEGGPADAERLAAVTAAGPQEFIDRLRRG